MVLLFEKEVESLDATHPSQDLHDPQILADAHARQPSLQVLQSVCKYWREVIIHTEFFINSEDFAGFALKKSTILSLGQRDVDSILLSMRLENSDLLGKKLLRSSFPSSSCMFCMSLRATVEHAYVILACFNTKERWPLSFQVLHCHNWELSPP